MKTATRTVPQELIGHWMIDPVHSEMGFSVRHLGVAKVRGRFEEFSGEIDITENPDEARAAVTIDAASFNTGHNQRDTHIKSADFLEVETYPVLRFQSTSVEGFGEEFRIHGDLTVHGVTRPVALDAEYGGVGTGLDGEPIIGFSATTKINRRDFHVIGGAASALAGDTITIMIEVEAKKS